jgi:hypothetical protein
MKVSSLRTLGESETGRNDGLNKRKITTSKGTPYRGMAQAR